jgi:uncharacterized protein YjbI with pentapeptide repeats
MLEPCDGKLSRTVLRGEGSRKAPALPGLLKNISFGFFVYSHANIYLYMNTDDHISQSHILREIENNKLETEANFIAQEHRLIPAIKNFFERKKWNSSDPRRVAAKHALLWRIFSPSSAIVIGGSAIGFCTLLILIWQGVEISKQTQSSLKQNDIISEQNRYFQLQNEKMQEQISDEKRRFLSTRRTELLKILFDQKNNTPIYNAKIRASSLIEYIELFPDNGDELNGALLQGVNLNHYDITGIQLRNADFSNAVLKKVTFSNSDLGFANFSGADIQQCDFTSTILVFTDFNESSIRDTKFDNADIARADFYKAEIVKSSFVGIDGYPLSFKSAYCLQSSFIFNTVINNKAVDYIFLAEAFQEAITLHGSTISEKLKAELLKKNRDIFRDISIPPKIGEIKLRN